MSEKKSVFLSRKFVWQFLLGILAIAIIAVIIFWKPIKNKYQFYKDWQYERRIQKRMGQEPFSWEEYKEYLKQKKITNDPEFIKKSFREDAEKSLGGKDPEELLYLLKQSLSNNNIEESLLFVHKLWRESYSEKWRNYIKDNQLSEIVKDFSLDKIVCNYDEIKSCEDNYCLFFQQTLSCNVTSENINILFVKNYANKWQLLEGLGL